MASCTVCKLVVDVGAKIISAGDCGDWGDVGEVGEAGSDPMILPLLLSNLKYTKKQ